VGALAAAFGSVFFALCFLALCCGAACVACADASLEDGAGTASAAQAGTTIKANNSNKFFIFTLPFWLKKQLRLALCGSRPTTTNNKQQNQRRSTPP
jgi:hypothetical protein